MQDNHIQYIELYTTDITKTKEFYTKTFGWEFTDYGENYVAFSNSGVEGGFEKVDAVTRGGVLVVLFHSNLEGAKAAVLESGGEITKDIFSFPGGQRFQFLDPSGNELAVWSEQ